MRTNIKFGSALAAVASFAFLAFAGGGTAYAEGWDDIPGAVTDLTTQSIVLAKKVNAAQAVPTANDTYTFSFTPTTDADGITTTDGVSTITGNATSDESAFIGPAISNIVLRASAMTDAAQIIEAKVSLPQLDPSDQTGTKISHAGLYEYIVKETSQTISNTQTDITDWEVSKAEYVMRLYVTNDANSLKYEGVTVERVVKDNGEPVTASNEQPGPGATLGVKVDPTDPDGQGDSATAGGDPVEIPIGSPTPGGVTISNALESSASGLIFANSYTKTSNLTIRKNILGDYADKNHAFPFSLTITLPDGSTSTNYSYDIYSRVNGTVVNTPSSTDANKTITPDTAVTFNLADGAYVVVKDLPVGTMYSIQETNLDDGASHYKSAARHTFIGKTGVTSGDFATYESSKGWSNSTPPAPSWEAANSTVVNDTISSAANIRTQLGIGGAEVVYTNQLGNPPSPTGIISHYGNYALLGLLALAGIAGFVLRFKWNKRK